MNENNETLIKEVLRIIVLGFFVLYAREEKIKMIISL